MRKNLIYCNIAVFWFQVTAGFGQDIRESSGFVKHTISPGLVMAGYQGWFNTPGDGESRGWHHFERRGRFEPGYCTIDLWPDMKEYSKLYDTDFKFVDGSSAQIFSSADESTVNLHFKWMQEYGIDGVFMQRFVEEIRKPSGNKHFTHVLQSATEAAKQYDRTVAVMYDLSGMTSGDTTIVMQDWKKLLQQFGYDQRSQYGNYLFDENKPVIAIWGVGFNDHRQYNLEDIKTLIRFFKSEAGGNCAILLGVPAYWRTFGNDCVKDTDLHRVIEMADIVHPWFVGRFNEDTYDRFKGLVKEDQKWCDSHHVKYMPVVFPGFSWNNMLPEENVNSTIPRNKGAFLWKQLYGATAQGAEMIYVAMFDEIDEGTAIFKIANKVPVGKSKFIPRSAEIPSDHYLWLTGKAGNYLKDNQTLPRKKPVEVKVK